MIATELLIASALGELEEGSAAQEQVDAHLLSCTACANRHTSFIRLGPALKELITRGGASVPATRALVGRLEAGGLITRRYHLRPGAVVPCTVDAQDVYSLTTYELDLSGVRRLDLYRAGVRIPDIPFDPETGRAYMLTSGTFLRKLPSTRMELRLVSVSPDGAERPLADFALEHKGFEG